MWLATTRGFYSVVDKLDREGYLCVRARVRGDLENLFELESLAGYTGRIDYPNFKSTVKVLQGRDRADAYMGAWQNLYGLQRPGQLP